MHLTKFHKSEKLKKKKKLRFVNENYIYSSQGTIFQNNLSAKQRICIMYTYSLNMQKTQTSST